MLYRNHAGDKPVVGASAAIHPSAVVIGNVQIGEKVFVGPHAVIRADEPCPAGKVEAIVIEREVNIQDGVIIQHQALVEGVIVPAGMHVPSMAGVLTEEDVRELKPANAELTAFAQKVRQTNVFLAEVG
jgi:carbonic anhydrase/acetyltransferase-like protein (isoleucine patch superfamily)